MNQSNLAPPAEICDLESAASASLAVVDHYAGNERFLKKALTLFATEPRVDVTVDLEDGAALGGEEARAAQLAEIGMTASQRRFGVRIHPLTSNFWLKDLSIFLTRCRDRLSHITIPKVEDPQLTAAALAVIRDLRAPFTTPENDTFGVHLLIESPRGLREIDKLATLRGVRCLDFGIMDFVSSFGLSLPRLAMQSPQQFSDPTVLAAKNAIVIAARANKLAASHNVTTQISPPSLTQDDATRAKQLGFTRMWSIHPDQVTAIISGFEPSAAEALLAEKVLTKAAANNWGPVEVDGVLYDRASYRWLWGALRRVPVT